MFGRAGRGFTMGRAPIIGTPQFFSIIMFSIMGPIIKLDGTAKKEEDETENETNEKMDVQTKKKRA
jgi:hypothetical protein